MTNKLIKSIKVLYTTFDKYHSISRMIGSTNYDDLKTWNEMLFSKPLYELNEDDLSIFAGKAITTWGTINDYKHFLPRILDLTAQLKTPYEIWITFDKLILTEFQNWLEEEQKVIHEYMIALWENIVDDSSEKAEWVFNDYFSTIAHFYPNFTDLLDYWYESKSKAGVKHLAMLIIREETALFERAKIRGFQDYKENTDEFVNWLLSDKVLSKIQLQYFEFEKESFSDKISWAEQILVQRRIMTGFKK